MYKQCRTEQSAVRQLELEQGLLEAMSQQRYDEISVSDLCERMQIPRKSFYRYFSGKDGALHALIDHALMDYNSFEWTEHALEKRSPEWDMARVFDYWKYQKPLLDALERSGLSGILIQRAIGYTQTKLELPLFLTRDDKKERDYITQFAVCGLMTLVVQWHHEGYPQSVQQMGHVALRLLSQPLFPNMENYY